MSQLSLPATLKLKLGPSKRDEKATPKANVSKEGVGSERAGATEPTDQATEPLNEAMPDTTETGIEIPDFMKGKKKHVHWTEEQRHALHMLKTRFDLNIVARRDVFNVIFRDELGPDGRNSQALESSYSMRMKRVELWRPVLEPGEESREMRGRVMRRIREAIAEVARRHVASQAKMEQERKEQDESVVVLQDTAPQRVVHATEQPAPAQKVAISELEGDAPQPRVTSASSGTDPPTGWFYTTERISDVPTYFGSLQQQTQNRRPLQPLSASVANSRATSVAPSGLEDPKGGLDGEKSPAVLSSSKQAGQPEQLPTLASALEKAVAEEAGGAVSGSNE